MSTGPLNRRKIVKKRTKKFHRHQAGRRASVPDNWRRPNGIDSRCRRRFRGLTRLVSIGYGSNKLTRGVLPDGYRKFRVNNVKDVQLLLMHNRKYAAEIASNVSLTKRKEIIKRAAELGVKVTNANARLRSEEAE